MCRMNYYYQQIFNATKSHSVAHNSTMKANGTTADLVYGEWLLNKNGKLCSDDVPCNLTRIDSRLIMRYFDIRFAFFKRSVTPYERFEQIEYLGLYKTVTDIIRMEICNRH